MSDNNNIVNNQESQVASNTENSKSKKLSYRGVSPVSKNAIQRKVDDYKQSLIEKDLKNQEARDKQIVKVIKNNPAYKLLVESGLDALEIIDLFLYSSAVRSNKNFVNKFNSNFDSKSSNVVRDYKRFKKFKKSKDGYQATIDNYLASYPSMSSGYDESSNQSNSGNSDNLQVEENAEIES